MRYQIFFRIKECYLFSNQNRFHYKPYILANICFIFKGYLNGNQTYLCGLIDTLS